MRLVTVYLLELSWSGNYISIRLGQILRLYLFCQKPNEHQSFISCVKVWKLWRRVLPQWWFAVKTTKSLNALLGWFISFFLWMVSQVPCPCYCPVLSVFCLCSDLNRVKGLRWHKLISVYYVLLRVLVTYGSWGNSSLLLFYFNVALCYKPCHKPFGFLVFKQPLHLSICTLY